LLVLDILCVTYFLTSITIPDPQTSDVRQLWHQLALASCEFYILTIS